MKTTTVQQNRKEYETTLAAKLGELGDKIDKMSADADQAKDEAKDKIRAEVESLRRKRAETRSKLEELKKASDNAWQDLKDGVDKAWSEVRVAAEKASARYDTKAGEKS